VTQSAGNRQNGVFRIKSLLVALVVAAHHGVKSFQAVALRLCGRVLVSERPGGGIETAGTENIAQSGHRCFRSGPTGTPCGVHAEIQVSTTLGPGKTQGAGNAAKKRAIFFRRLGIGRDERVMLCYRLQAPALDPGEDGVQTAFGVGRRKIQPVDGAEFGIDPGVTLIFSVTRDDGIHAA